MKIYSISVMVLALSVAATVSAHDIEEHMKNGEKPNCAAMKDVDMAKMNKDDPVTQALMKKCAEQMEHGEGHMAQPMTDHHDSDMHKGHDDHDKGDQTKENHDHH